MLTYVYRVVTVVSDIFEMTGGERACEMKKMSASLQLYRGEQENYDDDAIFYLVRSRCRSSTGGIEKAAERCSC
jgi:hypothetical protein